MATLTYRGHRFEVADADFAEGMKITAVKITAVMLPPGGDLVAIPLEVKGLIDTLREQGGEEGEALAAGLEIKAADLAGREWGDKGPPTWHPAHPDHPLHYAYVDEADKGGLYHSPDTENFNPHPLASDENYDKAVAGAREVIDTRAHPDIRVKLNGLLNGHEPEEPRAWGMPSTRSNPILPDSRLHALYLANPGFYHDYAGHAEGDDHVLPSHTYDTVGVGGGGVGQLMHASRRPDHPLNPDHPDHVHFIEAHSRGHFGSLAELLHADKR